MKKINLLYAITKLELGGAQKQLLTLISRLDKDKYNPFLFTARDGFLLNEALSIPGLKVKRSRFLGRSINLLKDFLALCEICSYIRRNKIDVVHTHSSKAGILGRMAAKLTKVKIIIHSVHGWSFNDYQPFFYRALFIWLESITARFTDRLIVVSRHDKEKGLANFIGNEDSYTLIRYGIDYQTFDVGDQNIKKELGIDTGDLVVGMVSCFKPQKSPQDFITIAFLVKQKLSNVKFLLVGDGSLRKEIEGLISKFNLQAQIILTGWRKDIPRILSAMDVFVLTSLWEGLPISVLEAMAASRPVIVTNTGGIAEVIVEGRTGFLVKTHDMNEMAKKLVILLKDENLMRTMGQNAKDSLGYNFALTNMLKCTQELYNNLAKTG